MGLLHDRIETDEHVIIRYTRFLAGVGTVISIMLVLLLVVRNLWLSIVVYGLLILVISHEMRPIRDELVAANKDDRVTRTGQRTSLKNPLTFYIKKDKPKGKRKPKRRR